MVGILGTQYCKSKKVSENTFWKVKIENLTLLESYLFLTSRQFPFLENVVLSQLAEAFIEYSFAVK